MEILKAQLKVHPVIRLQIEDVFEDRDWLTASTVIENAKREMFINLKAALHVKIATLSIDDIDFEIE